MSTGKIGIQNLLIIIFTLLIFGICCWSVPAWASTVPTLTTNSATSIDEDSATVNGEVYSYGNANISEYGFYWGTSSDCSTKQQVGSSIAAGNQYFAYTLTDLNQNTKYYYKAYAQNDNGIYCGSTSYFITYNDYIPEVTTFSASNVDDNSATLNAEIYSLGGSDIEQYGFYYGTTSSCSNKIMVGTDELDDGDDFEYELTGLSSDTLYYFQAYAQNDDGIAYGSISTFTTDDDSDGTNPSVTTKTPSSGSDYATLYGVVTSDGNSSIESYGFYYGTSSSPDIRIEVNDASIDEDEEFSYKLTGLSTGTTYYVRAYATNDEGTSYGSVLSFQLGSTVSTPVVVSPEKASVLTIGSKNYIIKGVSQTGDVAPYIKNSRTYMPIRPVAYALGINDADIIWDGKARQVTLTKGTTVVKLTINSNVMLVNSAPKIMETPPEITSARTCLPVAMVAEAFGAAVSWDAAAQKATIQ